VRLLNQIHGAGTERIRSQFPDLDVVEVPIEGDVDPDLTGDALVCLTLATNLEQLVPRVHALRVGLPTDPDSDYGPLVTAAALRRVEDYIGVGVEEGADLLVDGRGFSLAGHEHGFYIGPSLFDRVTSAMRIYREEIFGPVLVIARADTYEQALALPSEHAYGNGVAIFTRDGDTARDFTSRVDVGMVGVNVPIPVPMAYYSFGGWKQSLFGDTHVHGPEGVHFYTRGKVVTSRFADPATRGPDLGFPQSR